MPLINTIEGINTISFYVETGLELTSDMITSNSKEDAKVETIKDNCYKVTLTLDHNLAQNEKELVTIDSLTFPIEAADCARNVVTSYDRGVGERTILQIDGVTVRYSNIISPDIDVNCTWTVDNGNVEIKPIEGSLNNQEIDIEAKNIGTSTLTCTTKVNGKEYVDTYKIEVVKKVENPNFDGIDNFGIKKIYTYAGVELTEGKYVKAKNELNIVDAKKEVLDYDLFEFSFSDDGIIKLNGDGTFEILKDGVVEIQANWKHNDYFDQEVNFTKTISVVKDGVYVNDSDSLYKATEEGKKIVLTKDIEFASDFSESEIVNLLEEHKLLTTYDWQYYINNGYGRPTIKYILEFKNNVYGNGYTIDTTAISMPDEDPTNHPYFMGPLNFVAVGNRAAVKGQDNICFLVRTKGVLIDNVQLKAVKDRCLNEGDSINLSRLNYVGTTLEIMSDSEVINSRISNGRNVVRIYSGNDDNNVIVDHKLNNLQIHKEKVRVVIDSSIMSNAREFIVKIGSNRALKCNLKPGKGYEQAYFEDDNNKPFDHKDKLYNEKDEEFNKKYLLTDVTLRDSVLATSGLFSIGMETHFSGPFLAGEGGELSSTLKSYKWYDLAATSYGALLRLEGNVKLLDWKESSKVDSSTLIEVNGDTVGGGILSQVVKLDIRAMIDKVASKPNYKNILSTIDDKVYVHGGIAFYGGGNNYSKIDMSKFTGESLIKYNININVLAEGEEDSTSEQALQGNMLPLAAGTEDFTFYMYNGDSKSNYSEQQKQLEDGSAYSWLKGVLR